MDKMPAMLSFWLVTFFIHGVSEESLLCLMLISCLYDVNIYIDPLALIVICHFQLL